jgi:hypothetical protein
MDISGYTLEFEPTKGGAPHSPVSAATGPTGPSGPTATATIDLVVGTYTITVTAYREGTAIAEGRKTSVTISEGLTTSVSITLGPKANVGDGTFTYALDIPAGVSGPTLYITGLYGEEVTGGTIPLTAGVTNTGSLILASGYYKARLVLNWGSMVAGFNSEFIHIYKGLVSPLSGEFPPVLPQPVSDFDLTGYFPAPVTGTDPVILFEASQYNGVIRWKNDGVDHSGPFAGNRVYTAAITLTPNIAYTFNGVGANVFTHSGISGTNAANSGEVTIVFAPTAAAGGFSIDIGFNHGDIDVSGSNGENTIYRNGTPGSLILSVSGYENISWYVDAGATALTGNPVTLPATDYALGRHIVTFNGCKDGVPFSQQVPFTVAEGGFPLPLPSVERAEAYYAYLETIGDTRGSAADPIVLPMAMNLGNGTDTFRNLLVVIAAAGKYVDVDLALCYNMPPGAEFNPDYTVSTGKDRIVALTLPDEAESIIWGTSPNGIIRASFLNFSSLKSVRGSNVKTIRFGAFTYCTALTMVSFPEATSIESYAFDDCTALTTVNLPKVVSIGAYAFYMCALTMADFPVATSIDLLAFAHCTALTTVNLPAVTSIGYATFKNTALTTVNLPALTSINDAGSRVFEDCTALTTVNLPVLTSLTPWAFRGCTALTTVKLPEVTSIAHSVFWYTGTAPLTIVLPNAAPVITNSGIEWWPDDSYKTVTIERPSNSSGYDGAWQAEFKKLLFGENADITLIRESGFIPRGLPRLK